ncbi:MAG: ACP S-malonyltransferase [Gammaproteobacteria bacterium]
MKALLFPGQGVQKVGMLNSLFEEVSEVKSIIADVSKSLDFDLEDLLRNGPEEKINLTEFSQPTILVTSVLLAKYSNKLSNIDITAGLSLGEYSALVYSNCLELSDAVKLVNCRGRLMQEAVPEGTAGMLVVLNMPINNVYKMIDDINESDETINFSTDNADGVSVLAGKNSAIESCKNYIVNGEFRRVKTQMVQMSVPSHCYLLDEAQEELAKLLNEVEFKTPSIPVIPNVLAEPSSDVGVIQDSLINQLTKTVRWRETLDYLLKNNLSSLIDSGPGQTIINMARKIKDIEKISLE